MTLKEIVDGFKVTSLNFSEGSLRSMEFIHDGVSYSTKFDSKQISLELAASRPVAEFDVHTQKKSWYINHVCGASGYNPMMGDECCACKSSKLEETSDNIPTLMVDGVKYSKRLSEIFIEELVLYKTKFENLMKSLE